MKSIEQHYPKIVSMVMEYIIERKSIHPDAPLIELIQDFCVKKDCPIELVGDAIQSDEYFKSFVASDCEHREIELKQEIW